MKLLVCDDDISTIDVIQSQLNLQELGITTLLRAYNGEAAIEIIKKRAARAGGVRHRDAQGGRHRGAEIRL